MKNLLCVCASILFLTSAYSQSRIKADKYPSLLWEITGKGQKPSYLFGTMHVSSKMVFHLSDSFYLAIRNAQVVALETNPGTWQEDFSRYDMDGEGLRASLGRHYADLRGQSAPQDYLTINSLKLTSFEKAMEVALYSSPSIINSFLYRSTSETSGDFEEDTYLDLHIFQTGRKLGKKVCGVEDFDGSMQLVREAYADAARDKKKQRSFDYDEDFSYARMEEAYRTGNLDLLDTINKVNSQSAAFDEKFLYRRNEIQAASIDSILRTGTTLFAGVGAAHLPGSRGVIELLRRKGYRLRPIKMQERDSRHKESIESIKVPVQFSRQTAEDGFYSVSVPGKLYRFGRSGGVIEMKQFADMINGSYYMVTRLLTNAAIMGQSEAQVERKLDSVLYENIPGRILQKKAIVKSGYRGYDITNRTRRGDVQRYNIFITPFEVFIFKMSGNGDYVKTGSEADLFFNSIQLKELKPEGKKWRPASGGFEVEWPHQPLVFRGGDWLYAGYDAASKTAMEILRTEVHNHDFLEEDSFDLNLMEESFAASDCVQRILSRNWVKVDGYPALEATYRYKDSSLAAVRFIIQGPHYYTLLATAKTDNRAMQQFLRSFSFRPFDYGEAKEIVDTVLQFRVQSPVLLEKKNKLQMYPEEAYYNSDDDDDSLVDNGTYKSRLVASDSTGEKIFVSLYKPSQYAVRDEKRADRDSTAFKKEWVLRRQAKDTLSNGLLVYDYELGNRKSSRLLKGKIIARDGVGYKLQTEGDTLSAPSAFVTSFFQSFSPIDTLTGIDVKKKKAALLFSQFFSNDSTLHKKAVQNIGMVAFDSADFAGLKKCIQALTWNEKKYLPVKKAFIGKLAEIPTGEASDYLKALYYQAGDTVELQYAALEALLAQQTGYSFSTFGQLMQTDPPVLDVNVDSDNYPVAGTDWQDEEDVTISRNGSFLDNLADSLQLSAGIVKSLLPLISIDDYEQPVMNLLRSLVDSNLVHPQDYEAYLPKLILEAKQALKKQLIQEKNRAIAKAKKAEEETKTTDVYERETDDAGNSKLSRYATLLLPFRDQSPQVKALIDQLLKSNDKRLRYDVTMLLLRNGQQVPDSLLRQFASQDDFRYPLYGSLKKIGKVDRFPAAFKNQVDMTRSRLLTTQSYNRPDTLVLLRKMPLKYRERDGVLYFFRYKEKKEENTWKIAVAGLLPADSTQVEFAANGNKEEEDDYDFTALTSTRLTTDTPEGEQLQKLCRKLLYSRRKSAAQFYNDNDRYEDFNMMRMK